MESIVFDRAGYTIPALPNDTEALLDVAKNTRKIYQDRSDALEESNWWFDIPIFALAVGAASALFAKSSADLIGGFALGAGTVALARTELQPSPRATAYAAGANAMTCVYMKGQAFKGADADIEILHADSATLEREISKDTPLLALPSPPADDPILKELVSDFHKAKSDLQQALSAAKDALAVAQKEIQAGQSAVSTLSGTIMSIEDQVKKLVKLQPLDFGQALASLSGSLTAAANQEAAIQKARTSLAQVPAPTKPKAKPEGGEPAKIADEIAEMQTATQQLVIKSHAITSRSVSYVKIASDIQSCAGLAAPSSPPAKNGPKT
ncbi:MAG TPA: hypothetical protein VGU20_00490 [Stellaceae bacterium]|nr:hypothetical protein [Stellaceae bacterium]